MTPTGEYQVEDGHIHANATVPVHPLHMGHDPKCLRCSVCRHCCHSPGLQRCARLFTQSTQKKQAPFENTLDSITRCEVAWTPRKPACGV